MKYRWIVPDRENRADFKVIEYVIENGDRIYRYALEKAPKLAQEMNIHAPSGEERDEKKILANCFAGCIAENALIFRFNTYAKECRKHIQAGPTEFDKNRDEDQVDILVWNRENDKIPAASIEVRSSYGAVQNNRKRYREWFSIVGFYTSENKGRELVKDFYITVIFNFPQEDMYGKMVNREPIHLQLAAGCDSEFLKTHGTIDSLKNKGAKYRVVRPLLAGFPVDEMMDRIFERLGSQENMPQGC